MAIQTHFIPQVIVTLKAGQTGLVFRVRWEFISRSVHTRLQVSVCSGYDLCHCSWTKILIFIF